MKKKKSSLKDYNANLMYKFTETPRLSYQYNQRKFAKEFKENFFCFFSRPLGLVYRIMHCYKTYVTNPLRTICAYATYVIFVIRETYTRYSVSCVYDRCPSRISA